MPGIPGALPVGVGEVNFGIIFAAPAEFPAHPGQPDALGAASAFPSFLLPGFFPILLPQRLPFRSVFPGFAPGSVSKAGPGERKKS